MDRDFKDLLSTFNERKVLFLIIGGYAYAEYTEPRTTKDLDLFVRADPDNAQAVFRSLAPFGANLAGITPRNFESASTVFQNGVAPFRIDILHGISGGHLTKLGRPLSLAS